MNNTIYSYFATNPHSPNVENFSAVDILKFFSNKELDQFKKFIIYRSTQSSAKDLISLLMSILKFYRNKRNKDLKGYIINQLGWSERKLIDDRTTLSIYASDFLAYLNFIASPVSVNLYLTDELILRGFYEKFENLKQKELKKSDNTIISAEYFLQLYHLERQTFNYNFIKKKHTGHNHKEFIQSGKDVFRYFNYYFTLTINTSLPMLNWTLADHQKDNELNIVNDLINCGYFDKVYKLMELEFTNPTLKKYIRINSLVPTIFSGDLNLAKSSIIQFFDILKMDYRILEQDELYFFFAALRNSIRLYLKCQPDDIPMQDLEFEIIDYSLQVNAMVNIGDYFPFKAFKSLVEIAFENGRIDWVNNFYHTYKTMLEENAFIETREYFEIWSDFVNKNYDSVIEAKYLGKDIFVKLRILVLKLISQLESDEILFAKTEKVLKTNVNLLMGDLDSFFNAHKNDFSTITKKEITNFKMSFSYLKNLIYTSTPMMKDILILDSFLKKENYIFYRKYFIDKIKTLKERLNIN